MKSLLAGCGAMAVAAALLTGCKSTGQISQGAGLPEDTTKYDQENSAKFVLLDPGAQRSVTSSGIQKGQTEDGRLQVAVNVRNRENRRIQVQINCEFKDQQGFVVDSTPFETLILTENEQKTVRFAAMNTKAQDFTIRVRQAR